MNKIKIALPRDRIEAFCQKWGIVELSVFGSALRDDFGPESDVDVLVSYAPGQKVGLMEMVRMENELSGLLGRRADLVERASVEQSPNYIRRRHVLENLEPIYVAR